MYHGWSSAPYVRLRSLQGGANRRSRHAALDPLDIPMQSAVVATLVHQSAGQPPFTQEVYVRCAAVLGLLQF